MRLTLFIIPVLFLVLSSCNEEQRKSLSGKPTAFGTVNQINIIVDKSLWNGEVGDTVSYFLGAPYPILPQPEPQFDLRFLPTDLLYSNELTKELRTYIILANLNNPDSEVTSMVKQDINTEIQNGRDYTVKIARDKWAKGQLLFYVLGKNEEALTKAITSSHRSITEKVREFDTKLIDVATYMEGENNKLSEFVKQKYDVSLKIPGGYRKAIVNDTAGWIQYKQQDAISSLLITSREYTGAEQFTKKYIQDWTEKVIKRYISTTQPGSYMQLNDVDLPVLYNNQQGDEYYTGTLRAIWEMENAFMGGALMSKAFYSQESGRIDLIIGFVHAPGTTKRDYMQRIEHVVNSYGEE